MKENIKLSVKEVERLGLMRQVDKKNFTLKQEGEQLGISLRQVKRVRKRYLQEGERGLISQKRGQGSNRKIADSIRERAVDLLKTAYSDFGPTLACEKLGDLNEIRVSEETIRKWQIEEGLWKPKRKKECKVYQRRIRRSRFGEMLQGDGSPHDWFEGRGEKCALLQFVDDATGNTTVARFVPVENTEGYIDLLREHLMKYGRPRALYVDKHGVFRVNREELKKGFGITHFGSILKRLDIELICANSPQAKGRVERKNGFYQDRLVKEMRLLGFSTIREANAFLPRCIQELNDCFGAEPANLEDAHRPLREQDDLKEFLLIEIKENYRKI